MRGCHQSNSAVRVRRRCRVRPGGAAVSRAEDVLDVRLLRRRCDKEDRAEGAHTSWPQNKATRLRLETGRVRQRSGCGPAQATVCGAVDDRSVVRIPGVQEPAIGIDKGKAALALGSAYAVRAEKLPGRAAIRRVPNAHDLCVALRLG